MRNMLQRNQETNNNHMNNDKKLMRALKVKSISYLIAKTDMGDLTKTLRLNEDKYFYALDSVELDKETAVIISELCK